MSDLTRLGAAATAAQIARGAITAADLTDAYLARIAEQEAALHCYVTVLAESARSEAQAADDRHRRGESRGPLDGVPVAVKDNIDVAGAPTSNGMGARPGTVAARDAAVVGRLRAAGVVILGKLNMHEGALGGTTDNPHHGRTHNPWRPGHTPGGSSGGTGAAVAARLCAAGLGTDTMGSVRLPAAYCGVAGLKPTHGLISARGVVPLCARLEDIGPLARSASDLVALLDALEGFDPECEESVSRPAPRAGARARRGLRGVTVGLVENFEAVALDPDVERAFGQALDVLRRLGCAFRRVQLPGYDPARARRAGFAVCEAEGAVVHESAMTTEPGAFSPAFRAMLEFGRDLSSGRLVAAERMVRAGGMRLRRALAEVDVIASPTAPSPAFSFEDPVPPTQADLTAIANFSGCPAVSVPCGLGRGGLPIGLQLIGAPFADRALLAAAVAFEAAAGVSLDPPEAPLRQDATREEHHR